MRHSLEDITVRQAEIISGLSDLCRQLITELAQYKGIENEENQWRQLINESDGND